MALAGSCLAVVALAGGTPARAGLFGVQAGSPSFAQCDGYGWPTKGGDGMSTQAWGAIKLFGRGDAEGGNTRRITPVLGQGGVDACTSALADPALLPDYWMRRVSLLRARAIHQIAAGHMDAALADLDKAEAAATDKGDPFYQRSMGLGIRLVRSYLFKRSGKPEAAALAEGVLVERPFDRQVVIGVIAAMGSDRVVLAGQPLVRHMARLSPADVNRVAAQAFDHGDFAAYSALNGQMVPPLKVIDIGGAREAERYERLHNRVVSLMFEMESSGRLAYAQAALGRGGTANQTLDAAALRLAGMTPEPSASQEGESRSVREAREDARTMLNWAPVVGKAMAEWRRLVGLRIAFDSGNIPRDVAAMAPLPKNGAGADLLLALRRYRPDTPGIDALLMIVDGATADQPTTPAQDAQALFESMPHAEIPDQITAYRKAASGFEAFWTGRDDGFTTTRAADGSGATVTFVADKGSAGVVEELALLRAAELAKEAGKGGLILVSRSDYQRTINNMMYGTVISTVPNGYSTRLDVVFVDPDHLPAAYAAAPWRVVKAAEVIDRLGPTYFPQQAPAQAPGNAPAKAPETAK